MVRRLVGYGRYDTAKQLAHLNGLYKVCRLYFNRFLPVTKLIKTEHPSSPVKKIYDAPNTPYQRVLDSHDVSDEVKAKLRREHLKLDVVTLKRQLEQLLAELKPTKQW